MTYVYTHAYDMYIDTHTTSVTKSLMHSTKSTPAVLAADSESRGAGVLPSLHCLAPALALAAWEAVAAAVVAAVAVAVAVAAAAAVAAAVAVD